MTKALYSSSVKKNYPQTVLALLGMLMVVFCLIGLMSPDFMGMHLSTMHSFVLGMAGVLSLWGSGLVDDGRDYIICLVLGVFFTLNSIVSLLTKNPATPHFDEVLRKIAPGFLELGFVDNIFHLLLGLFFISAAISWRRHLKV